MVKFPKATVQCFVINSYGQLFNLQYLALNIEYNIDKYRVSGFYLLLRYIDGERERNFPTRGVKYLLHLGNLFPMLCSVLFFYCPSISGLEHLVRRETSERHKPSVTVPD